MISQMKYKAAMLAQAMASAAGIKVNNEYRVLPNGVFRKHA
jgi:hypothetical protein